MDSGSTHSFINELVAKNVLGRKHLSSSVSVQVANGTKRSYDSEIPMAEWSVQQYKFHSMLNVLDIGLYDMIVGMDWLQAFLVLLRLPYKELLPNPLPALRCSSTTL